jgi:hypothetical protein
MALRPALLWLGLALFAASAEAAGRTDRVIYAHAAVTMNYIPSLPRFGRKSFEFGVSPVGLILGRVARSTSTGGYATIGLLDLGGGLYAGVGYELPILPFLDLRAEALSAASFSGNLDSAVTLGVNVGI